MSRLVPRKYKVLKGINNILVLKLIGVSRNNTRGFLIYTISRLVPIKRIKVRTISIKS